MKLTQQQIDDAITEGVAALERTGRDRALVYPDGSHGLEQYDRKRSRGQGPRVSTWKDKV